MLALEGKLMKELLVYIFFVSNYPLSKKFLKAYVGRECVNFFHNTISKFPRDEEIYIPELEVTDNQLCKEITAKQVKVLPKKKKISSANCL
jgi:hypothetical protein